MDVPSHDEDEAEEEWERREQIEATISPISSDNEIVPEEKKQPTMQGIYTLGQV